MRVAPRPPRGSRARAPRSRLFSFARASPQGYHRSYTANDRVGTGDRSKARGVCYHKVAGAPACTDIAGLLHLRPLVRRKKRPAEDDDDAAPARRRRALAHRAFSPVQREGLRRARAESTGSLPDFRGADAANCLLSILSGASDAARAATPVAEVGAAI